MIVNLYAVHDAKAGAYLPPFPLQTDGLAVRSFQEAVLNPQTQISKYPLDYSLFRIATYDDETSIIRSELPPELVINASQALKLAEKQHQEQNLQDEILPIGEDNEISNES